MASLKIRSIGVSAVVFAILASASLVWACSGQPYINGLTVRGASGSTVIINGEWFGEALGSGAPGGEAVKINWNNRQGPELATVSVDAKGSFSVPVTIPKAAPGVYFILAGSGDLGIARTPFEVTAPSGVPSIENSGLPGGPSADLWNGFNPGSTEVAGTTASNAEGLPAGMAAGAALVAVGAVALAATSLAGALAFRKRRLS